MILPGVSGAFILVLLGKYQYVLSAVNTRDVVSLLFVAAGAGIGIVTFAQLIGYLFKRFHDMTVAVLTGLMLGSLRKVWPWKLDIEWLRDAAGFVLDGHGERIVTRQNNILPDLTVNGAFNTEILIALALALLGLGLVLLLDRVARVEEP
jgi:putative membrane protein